MKIEQKHQKEKSAQEVQDEIFRKMTAEKKLKLGSEFWQLAKDLTGSKIDYGKYRSASSFGKNR